MVEIYTCDICKEPFIKLHNWHSRRVCSPECFKARRKQIDAKFYVNHREEKIEKQRERRERNKKEIYRKCEICGKTFFRGKRDKRVCSQECFKVRQKIRSAAFYRQHKDNKEPKGGSKKLFKYKCEVCGKVYERVPEWRSKKVCSDECKKIRKKLKCREYWDKVKDEVNARKRKDTAKPKTRQKKRSADTLADINALAREQGLSYGQMQGLLYAQRNCIIRRRKAI